MPDEKTPFLKETVKDEEVTGKKIGRMFAQMIARGLIFGIAASLSFYALKPFAEACFHKDDVTVSIPTDEMEEGAEPDAESGDAHPLTVENYREMNEALYEVAKEARNSVVEIRSDESGSSWKEADGEGIRVSGIVVWKQGAQILLLAPYGELPLKGGFIARFSDDTECAATLKSIDENLKFGIYTVAKRDLKSSTLRQIQTAKFGNSYLLEEGNPVIALGTPFGYSDGMGYGVISSMDHGITFADHKYRILMTDITAASQGSGALFNVEGEVVGIIDQRYTNTAEAELVSAYSVSEIKSEIERLSNGKEIPYLGIIGAEVTAKISEKEGIPRGIYVKEVEADSPAMEAGIQCGDVVIRMNDTEIVSQKTYSKVLMDSQVGDQMTVLVNRQGLKEYKEITFKAVVGSRVTETN